MFMYYLQETNLYVLCTMYIYIMNKIGTSSDILNIMWQKCKNI